MVKCLASFCTMLEKGIDKWRVVPIHYPGVIGWEKLNENAIDDRSIHHTLPTRTPVRSVQEKKGKQKGFLIVTIVVHIKGMVIIIQCI